MTTSVLPLSYNQRDVTFGHARKYDEKRITVFSVFMLFMLGGLLLSDGAFAKPAPASFADLAKKLLPAVVNISTSQNIKREAPPSQRPQLPPGSPLSSFSKNFLIVSSSVVRQIGARLHLAPALLSIHLV